MIKRANRELSMTAMAWLYQSKIVEKLKRQKLVSYTQLQSEERKLSILADKISALCADV